MYWKRGRIEKQHSVFHKTKLNQIIKSKRLPYMYWLPKPHKKPTESRFICTKMHQNVLSNLCRRP